LASTIQVLVPDIGDFEEVEVIEVLVATGDRVDVEDSLITLESDKATMEIPSPRAGVVAQIVVQLGDLVSEGSMLLTLESVEDVQDDASQESQPLAEGSNTEPLAPEETPAPAPTGPEPRLSPGDREPHPPPMEPGRSGGETLPHASPLVRKQARELGVDLSEATGSGLVGRILEADLKAHVRRVLGGPAQTLGTGTGIPAVRSVDFKRYGEVEEVPLARIRQRAGRNLSASWLNLPHVTQHDEADITGLEAYRKSKASSAADQGVRLSPLVFVMKGVVLALRQYPEFASSLSPDGTSLFLKKSFHLGIAVDTENGLVVPVVRDVNRKRLLELARETAELAEAARDGRLAPDQMQGAVFTISSLGGIGGTAFTPIVNAPEVALLGVSRTVVKPVWSAGLDVSSEGGGRFEPRLILPLSLSYDHRVIDGAAAVRFTTFLRSTLEDPANLLL
jgi:pyruvate dehydrogenase E2 component (dihydrolipoamide acetyltransferase)